MDSIAALMTHDHRRCDHLFAAAEALAAEADWSAAAAAVANLARELEAHFSAEEEILFPRFEAASGMTHGPTAMMRAEHADMRASMRVLQDAIAAHDRDEFAGEADTLLIMMQQHNMKEEHILYPMCDAHLGAAHPPTVAELGVRLQPEQVA